MTKRYDKRGKTHSSGVVSSSEQNTGWSVPKRDNLRPESSVNKSAQATATNRTHLVGVGPQWDSERSGESKVGNLRKGTSGVSEHIRSCEGEGGQANLEVSRFVDEEVLRLEIAMQDPSRV
jgi:hypothetical protein